MLKKIRLSWKYGKAIYVISSILTLSMTAVAVFYPTLIPDFILIKIFSIPLIYYLCKTFNSGLNMYFYLNLGMSRYEYRFIPFLVEFVAFVLLMVLVGVIGHAIG